MTALVPVSPNAYILPTDASAVERARLPIYVRWLDSQGRRWDAPDLRAYRDWLIGERYGKATVAAYLVTVRSRYKAILRDNALMTNVMQSFDGTPADQWAAYSAWRQAVENAIHPSAAPVRVPKVQDRTDDERRWITVEQARELLAQPRLLLGSVHGAEMRIVRDQTMLLMMLLTGVRREELVNATFEDANKRVQGERGLYIPEGKGCKKRFVFYGEFERELVDALANWQQHCNRKTGYIFMPLKPPDFMEEKSRGRMALDSVNDVFKRYPIVIDGENVSLPPHSTRRFYALLLRDGGMDLPEIALQLGHEGTNTLVKNYLPPTDVARRLPRAVW